MIITVFQSQKDRDVFMFHEEMLHLAYTKDCSASLLKQNMRCVGVFNVSVKDSCIKFSPIGDLLIVIDDDPIAHVFTAKEMYNGKASHKKFLTRIWDNTGCVKQEIKINLTTPSYKIERECSSMTRLIPDS